MVWKCGKCGSVGLYRDDNYAVGDFAIVCPICGNRYYAGAGRLSAGIAPVRAVESTTTSANPAIKPAAGRLGRNDSDYETLVCPICGKILGALCVEGRAVYKKDPCPRCGRTVYIEKDLTPRPGGRRMPKPK